MLLYVSTELAYLILSVNLAFKICKIVDFFKETFYQIVDFLKETFYQIVDYLKETLFTLMLFDFKHFQEG